MKTIFRRLNDDWNAEPNAPDPRIRVDRSLLSLSFLMNYMLYSRLSEDDLGVLRFHDCWRYRIGSTNDEGWYRGQCRFTKLAPQWGDFYEISGDLLLDQVRGNWTNLAPASYRTHHYLFYFKDETFECDASGFDFEVIPHGARGRTADRKELYDAFGKRYPDKSLRNR